MEGFGHACSRPDATLEQRVRDIRGGGHICRGLAGMNQTCYRRGKWKDIRSSGRTSAGQNEIGLRECDRGDGRKPRGNGRVVGEYVESRLIGSRNVCISMDVSPRWWRRLGWMREALRRNRYVHAPGIVTSMYFDRSHTIGEVWGRERWDEVRFLLSSS